LIPLILLAVGAVFAGFLFNHVSSNRGWPEFCAQRRLQRASGARHARVPAWVKWSPFVVMLIGLGIAYRNYIAKPDAPAAFVAMFPHLHRF
jgi:NADH-quinone oxidoreductase subunit L